MKDSKIVVNGHGWNRSASLRILVGLVSLLTVALASGAGSHSVHNAGSMWLTANQVAPAGSMWL
jgi:hypothetical protein